MNHSLEMKSQERRSNGIFLEILIQLKKFSKKFMDFSTTRKYFDGRIGFVFVDILLRERNFGSLVHISKSWRNSQIERFYVLELRTHFVLMKYFHKGRYHHHSDLISWIFDQNYEKTTFFLCKKNLFWTSSSLSFVKYSQFTIVFIIKKSEWKSYAPKI